MTDAPRSVRPHRARWAAIGAAIAVTLGAGGIGITQAAVSTGERTVFVPITPCRLADTRLGQVGTRATPIGPGDTFTLTAVGVNGNCTLPPGATGVSLNVTAVNPTAETYFTIFPTGAAQPVTSSLNPKPGQPPTPNAVNVDLNGAGQFSIFNFDGTSDVIVDVVGYYEDHNHDDRYPVRAAAKDVSVPFTSKVIAAGACIIAGVGDGTGTGAGVFSGNRMFTVAFVDGTNPLYNNLGLVPATTKTGPGGFGIATFLICNYNNVGTITLNGTIQFRIVTYT